MRMAARSPDHALEGGDDAADGLEAAGDAGQGAR